MNRRAYLSGGNARYAQTGRCLQISETDFPREFRSFRPTFSSKIFWRSFQQLFWKTCVMPKWLKIIPILWWLTGCAAAVPALPLLSGLIPAPGGTQILTTTEVNLSGQNFKIVKTNAIGSSVGFSFLGLIPLKSPGYDEAITKLYQNASVSEGKAQALVNVVHENSSTYFILFALPKITVRADVIEFTDGAVPVKNQDAESVR